MTCRKRQKTAIDAYLRGSASNVRFEDLIINSGNRKVNGQAKRMLRVDGRAKKERRMLDVLDWPPGLYCHHRLGLSVHALSLSHVLLILCRIGHIGHLSTVRWAKGAPSGRYGHRRSRELNAIRINGICRWGRRRCGNILSLNGRHVWWNRLHALELTG